MATPLPPAPHLEDRSSDDLFACKLECSDASWHGDLAGSLAGTTSDCLLLPIITYYHLALLTNTHHRLLPLTITYYYLPLLITAYSSLLIFTCYCSVTITYYYLPLPMISYHYLLLLTSTYRYLLLPVIT